MPVRTYKRFWWNQRQETYHLFGVYTPIYVCIYVIQVNIGAPRAQQRRQRNVYNCTCVEVSQPRLLASLQRVEKLWERITRQLRANLLRQRLRIRHTTVGYHVALPWHAVPIYHLQRDTLTISIIFLFALGTWQIQKLPKQKSFRTSKILTLLYQQFSNLLISQRDKSGPRLGALSNY